MPPSSRLEPKTLHEVRGIEAKPGPLPRGSHKGVLSLIKTGQNWDIGYRWPNYYVYIYGIDPYKHDLIAGYGSTLEEAIEEALKKT